MENTLDYILKKFSAQGLDPTQPPIQLRMSRHREFLELWHDLGYQTGAEVGVETGRYSEEICRAMPGVKLYCIDPWQTYDRYADHVSQSRLEHFYNATVNRLTVQNQFNVDIIRETSLEAVARFEPASLDFVFIDGNHHFDFVVEDIIAWSPIVRPGGIVAGHDYKPEGGEKIRIPFGVIEAVNAYTTAHKISPWFVTRGDKCPTWFWVTE